MKILLAPNNQFIGYVADDINIAEGYSLLDVDNNTNLHDGYFYTEGAWHLGIKDLNEQKILRREYINESRLLANQRYFEFQGKQIAVDPVSRSDIDGVVGKIALTGTFPEGWPGGWKTLDNSYVSIPDIDTWALFYTAMVNQGTANFIHAQNLKAQIDAATTPEEVAAITW